MENNTENLNRVSEQNSVPSVLIIEDEESERVSLKVALEAEGLNVKVAEDGASAEEALKKNFFDIMIVDYRLPDIDGLNLIKKTKLTLPDLIPVVVTAYSSVEIAIEAMKMGAYDYMSKPLDIPALLKTISKIMEYKNTLFNSKKTLTEFVTSGKITYSTENNKIMIIATPDTNVLVEKKDTKQFFVEKIKNVFAAIKNYYWGS